MHPAILAATGLLLAAPAMAGVTSVSEAGFALQHQVTTDLSPKDAFARLTNPGDWWNPSHTWSGDAANMTLEARAGGCFCETWPDGSVEHMRVHTAQPGRFIVLRGALGPLSAHAVTGSMRWSITARDDGGSDVTFSYAVSGVIEGGMESWAPIVDGVIAEQATRFAQAS